MRDQAEKIFIASLDGATFDVLLPLVHQGYMPNLARMLESGPVAELESVVPPVTAPAWTSFMTGKNPNKHGIFDFTRFDFEHYDWKINNSQHIRSKTIWQILSDHHKQVVVIGLPYTFPTYEVNGAMVAGWDAPSKSSFTYPEDLSREILTIFPDYGSSSDLSLWNHLSADSEADFDNFIDKLIRSFEETATLASQFLKTKKWDVFMVHFQQTDWIQHKLWGYIERACRDTQDHHWRLEQVRKCYQAFDRYVGKLLAEVSPLSPLRIVLSDHGFGSNRGTIYPNHVLRKLGYYHLKAQADGPLKKYLKHSDSQTVRTLYRTLKGVRNNMQARQVVKQYKNWADMIQDSVPGEKSSVDWHRTKAAFVGGSEAGFIFINVKGRGPYGCVEPGSEYEDIVSRIFTEFRGLANSETGQPLLTRVARGSEVYSDEENGVLLPDIVLVPQEGYVVGAGLSDSFLASDGERGDHRHNGVLLLESDELKRKIPTLNPHLIDLAPTILHALDLPVPTDMDGRVLEEIFEHPRTVQFQEIDNSTSHAARDYDQNESEIIEQRLRGLGYVE